MAKITLTTDLYASFANVNRQIYSDLFPDYLHLLDDSEELLYEMLDKPGFEQAVEPTEVLHVEFDGGQHASFDNRSLWFARHAQAGCRVTLSSECVVFQFCIANGQAGILAVWSLRSGWLGHWSVDGDVEAALVSNDQSQVACVVSQYSFVSTYDWECYVGILGGAESGLRQASQAAPIALSGPSATVTFWSDERLSLQYSLERHYAIVSSEHGSRYYSLQ